MHLSSGIPCMELCCAVMVTAGMPLLCVWLVIVVALSQPSQGSSQPEPNTMYTDTLHSYLHRYHHVDLHNQRLLISTTRGTLGLGNRMLAHASALAYALLTNRTLLMHSPDVDLNDIFSFPHDNMVISQRKYNKFFKNANNTKRLDASHDGTVDDWRMLVCGDLNSQNDVLVVTGGQYFLPLLFAKHELWFRTIFPDFTTVYHQIARSLFRPSPAVELLIAKGRQMTHKGNPLTHQSSFDLGVQLRSFKFRHDKQQDVSAQECIDRNHLNHTFIFVASLYKQHRAFFKDTYKHADTLSSFELQSNQLEQFQFALAEMIILSQSGTLIVSPYSTFGYTAIALQPPQPHQHVYMLDQRVSCRLMSARDREPCFHKAPRFPGYCADGTLVWPDRERLVRACPDYRRGLKF